jgi:hypothetical protein
MKKNQETRLSEKPKPGKPRIKSINKNLENELCWHFSKTS